MTEGNEDTIFYRQDGQSTDWEDWWKNEDSVIYNFMGQDNLVFHALMWPGELIGMKSSHSLPKYVVVNKFLNYEGKKFSKSRNWTIDSKKIADKYGVDLVRYYVARTLPENKEGNFTWEDFVSAINNELVANLGNLVNRTLTFIQNKFGGEISVDRLEKSDKLDTSGTFERVNAFLGGDEKNGPFIVKALDEIMELSRKGNVYFDEQKVWEVVKQDEEKAKQILINLVNMIYDLAVMVYPFLPDTSDKLMRMLGKDGIDSTVGENLWQTNRLSEESMILKVKLGKIELLFQKLDLEMVLAEKEE
jgi:methionyl-tRNA synthetase